MQLDRFLGQSAVLVKPLCCIGDHHFQLIDHGHIPRDEHLPKIVLRTCRSQAACRRTIIAAINTECFIDPARLCCTGAVCVVPGQLNGLSLLPKAHHRVPVSAVNEVGEDAT